MTAHSSDTRELREDERTDEESRSRARRAASTVASVNENGRLSLLVGGVLLARGAWSLARSDRRGRALLQGVAGAALLAVGLRQRRSGVDEGSTGEDVSDEASAHREGSTVLDQDETNPRGTSGEPDVERQTDAGNVEFSDDQDLESGRKPGMDDEDSASDTRSDDEAEVDLSEASMADEASEATGPSSTQAQPAQTDDTEPERTSEADPATDQDTAGDDDPDPDADPGEATEEAASAEPADVADEVIEGEIDDDEREGVVTEGGATVHTDTNESDDMDIDVDDVTDPDDEMNTEPADSEEQSDSHLDDEPPDEDEEKQS